MKKFILSLCKAGIIATAALITITGAAAQDNKSELSVIAEKMSTEALMARSYGDYEKAAGVITQAINIISMQPADIQAEYRKTVAELYYDLARYNALQRKNDEAYESLGKAIELGWNDCEFAESDGDLSTINRSKKFKKLMEQARNKS